MTADVLLSVSGVIPDGLDADVASGARPQTDYRAMENALGYETIDERVVFDRSRLARFARTLFGRHMAFAVGLFRSRRGRSVVVTDAEHTGLPFAALLRLGDRGTTRHVMICHRMSSRAKRALIRWLRLERSVDRWIVYSTAQERVLIDDVGIDPKRVRRIDFGTDTSFFRPAPGSPRPMVLSVGSAHRDYETLAAAVDGLDVETVVVANSPWVSDRRIDIADAPSSMRFVSLSWRELRRHYQQAQLVVVPLEATDYQAGVTAILEAMASGRPVVYTKTIGQTDVVDDGVTGLPVRPADVEGLRAVIADLLQDPDRAESLGEAGRAAAVARFGLGPYVRAIGSIVDEVR